MKLFTLIAALVSGIVYLIDRWVARQIDQAIREWMS